MAVFTSTSSIPHGVYAWLKRLRDMGPHAVSPGAKARAFCRRQGWATCSRRRGGEGHFASRGWQYEITEEGRRAILSMERQDALDL